MKDLNELEDQKNELILGFPKEVKLQVITTSPMEVALPLAKLLLDTPISEGGISTDEINEALKINLNNK